MSNNEFYNVNDMNIKTRVADFLVNIFSLNQIEELLDRVSTMSVVYEREIDEEQVEILRLYFKNSNDVIVVYDVLHLDVFPAQRYLDIHIAKHNSIYRFKIKYDRNFYNNFIEIFCRAYNMSRYKSSNKDIINMTNNNILNTYAANLAKLLPDDEELMDHLRYISNNLFLDIKNIKNNNTYFKILKISNKVNIEISSRSLNIIKFVVSIKSRSRLIYLNKSIIGIHNISLIMNKMYKYKRLNNKKKKNNSRKT